ncbi:MAG: type IV secretory system conjugative DNA transfer family protein [Alphaproteobacteria bacterium]|nr:type IV secretory system conjugative DNA transfer family protein [Alphaproteobacteria bacterium]
MRVWSNTALAACVALSLAACAPPRLWYAPPEERGPGLLAWLGFAPEGSLVLGGPDDLGLGAPPRRLAEVEVTITEKPPAPAVARLRRDQLVRTAQAWGAQLGYDRAAWEVERALERRSSSLSATYDFSRVASPGPRQVGYVIPPVVERSFEAFDGDGREAAAADEFLLLRAPGRIRPVMPTWRDWLLMTRPEPRRPSASALPATPEETELFRRAFREGWRAGERQAMDELRERLRRLGRDFGGMLEYRRLVALGMMRQIVLSDADFGVIAGDRSMRIGARTVRIESDAAFRPEPDAWRPALALDTGSGTADAGGGTTHGPGAASSIVQFRSAEPAVPVDGVEEAGCCSTP